MSTHSSSEYQILCKVVNELQMAKHHWVHYGEGFGPSVLRQLCNEYNLTTKNVDDLLKEMLRTDLLNSMSLNSMGVVAYTQGMFDQIIQSYYAFIKNGDSMKDYPHFMEVLKEAGIVRGDTWFDQCTQELAKRRERDLKQTVEAISIDIERNRTKRSPEYMAGFSQYVAAIARRLFDTMINRGLIPHRVSDDYVDNHIRKIQTIKNNDCNGYFVSLSGTELIFAFRDDINAAETQQYMSANKRYTMGPMLDAKITQTEFTIITDVMAHFGFVVAQDEVGAQFMRFTVPGIYDLTVTVQVSGVEPPFHPFLIKD